MIQSNLLSKVISNYPLKSRKRKPTMEEKIKQIKDTYGLYHGKGKRKRKKKK